MDSPAKTQLLNHIREKIMYHEQLRLKFEAEEEYEQCALHRDEIARLKSLIGEE